MANTKIPTFDELKKRDGPPLNAWGIWGEDNQLGQINHLTPEAVKRGRDAIKHGKAVNLKYVDLEAARRLEVRS